MRYRFPYVSTDLRSSARHQLDHEYGSASRDVPVYFPSFRRVLIPAYPQTASSGWVDLGGLPVKDGHAGTNRACVE